MDQSYLEPYMNKIAIGSITFFPTSSEPISLSHRTAFAPLIVAIFSRVSAGRAVGFVVPLMYASRPLLIRDAKYISSTVQTKVVNVKLTTGYQNFKDIRWVLPRMKYKVQLHM